MRANRLLLVFFLCLGSATTNAVAETARLEPRSALSLGTQIERVAYNFGVCWPFELDRRGIGRGADLADRPGELLVGFDNTVVHGASCHQHVGTIFTGALRFDLSDLRVTPIVSATLNVFSRITNNRPRTRERSFSGTCLMQLEIATGFWREGETFRNDVTGDFPSMPFADRVRTVLLASSAPRSTSVDITRLVQRWARGAQPNHGLVLKVRDRSIIRRDENNDSCTSYVSPLLYLTVWR